MSSVSVLEAKTNLSRYLELAESGEVVVICRHNKPVAELRALPAAPAARTRPPRKPGLLKGKISWTKDAFSPMSDQEADQFFGDK